MGLGDSVSVTVSVAVVSSELDADGAGGAFVSPLSVLPHAVSSSADTLATAAVRILRDAGREADVNIVIPSTLRVRYESMYAFQSRPTLGSDAVLCSCFRSTKCEVGESGVSPEVAKAINSVAAPKRLCYP